MFFLSFFFTYFQVNKLHKLYFIVISSLLNLKYIPVNRWHCIFGYSIWRVFVSQKTLYDQKSESTTRTMFIREIRRDFYNIVIKKKILLLVSLDVDAVCALKILQFLFETDNVQYTAIPVSNVADCVKAYNAHSQNINCLILLNVGSTFDVIEDLDVNSSITVFVADSHRPVNFYNIYREEQIFLLMKPDDNETVPNYADVIGNESDDTDYDSENDQPQGYTLQELQERKRKRQIKMDWAMKAAELINKYYQFSYYGEPIALTMFELAWKLSRDSTQVLWYGIVGIFDHFFNEKIEPEVFENLIKSLKGHTSRLNHIQEERNASTLNYFAEASASTTAATTTTTSGDDGPTGPTTQSLTVTHIRDLSLVLYRHWSFFESLRHTILVSSKFKIWTPKGHNRLLEFLAELGIPLTQAKQKFMSMDVEFKKNILTWVLDLAEKYNLEQIEIDNFIVEKGYKIRFTACDVAFAIRALLESPEAGKNDKQKFFDALDALSWSNISILEHGFETAKMQASAILKQVHHILDMNSIGKAGPFFYCVITDSAPDAKFFGKPGVLIHLSKFLLAAFVSKTKFKKADSFPLVMMAPDLENPGTGLAVGIPPIAEQSPRNFFAEAFKQIVETELIDFEVKTELYDSNVVRFPYNEKNCGEIISSLTSLLQ